jgi:hypothetical protein
MQIYPVLCAEPIFIISDDSVNDCAIDVTRILELINSDYVLGLVEKTTTTRI